jgi:hypothetical protein
MLVATFNATTGWAGRQISWQDDRFILDGHGAITAFDLMGYDGQGQLDWVSEEMRSWAGARYSWELAVADSTAAAPAMSLPVVSEPAMAQPLEAQPVISQPSAPEAAVADPETTQPAVPAAAVFGGTAAEPTAGPAANPATTEAAVVAATPATADPEHAETMADEPAAAEPTVTPPMDADPAAPVTQAGAEPATKPTDEVRDVLAPGGDIQEVVGSAPFQEALAAIIGTEPGAAGDVEKWAHLIPEPENPWDRNAVAVYIDARKVGYLQRETSPAYAAILGRLWAGSRGRAVCRAVVSGGWRQVQSQVGSVTTVDDAQFGVRLALAAPQHFASAPEPRPLTAEELANGPTPV